MQKRIVSLVAPLLAAIIALALGWFAHAAAPLAAQSIAGDGLAALSDPSAPATLTGAAAHLTYQGRLLSSGGVPVNSPITATFRIYSDTSPSAIWTSALRTITPTNGLFTVYLGAGADPNLYPPVLVQAASIGVAVGGDAEMTPRQPLNTLVGHSVGDSGVVGSSISGTGVIGHSDSASGVVGSSNSYYGVEGTSTSNLGVYGHSQSGTGVYGYSASGDGVYGTSPTGPGVHGAAVLSFGVYGSSVSGYGVLGSSAANDGVVGTTGVMTRAGVLAGGAGLTGTALSLTQGGIQVQGAGIGTGTPVFTVKVVTATLGNNVNPSACNGYCVVIDNPLTNGRPDAIVIITPNLSPAGAFNALNNDHPVGVWYDFMGGRNKWEIIHPDGTLMLNGAAYNVLVVNP